MGSIVDNVSAAGFAVLTDPHPEDTSLPAFMVSKTRGFLPRADPVVALPAAFDPLESLLTRMPVRRLDGQPGLLASGSLGATVVAELPDLTEAVNAVQHDLPMLNALYRDYAFLASAYLLEPCHMRFLRGESYGLGRDVLPASIARPIARCAKLCVSLSLLLSCSHFLLSILSLLSSSPSSPPLPHLPPLPPPLPPPPH